MKHKLWINLVAVTLLFNSYTYCQAETNSFNDVKNTRWSYPYISEVTDAGYINGYSDNTFKPSNNITRAEAVSVLNNYLKKNNRITEIYSINKFLDVPDNAWYSQAVKNISSLGIITGDKNGKICLKRRSFTSK